MAETPGKLDRVNEEDHAQPVPGWPYKGMWDEGKGPQKDIGGGTYDELEGPEDLRGGGLKIAREEEEKVLGSMTALDLSEKHGSTQDIMGPVPEEEDDAARFIREAEERRKVS